jgi:hypothetical protein
MLMFALTALEKLQKIPASFWITVVAGVLLIVSAVIVLRKLAGTNKVILAVVAFIIFTVVGVNWIYERNEPAFMTPAIDKIAPFLPAKGAYDNKQKQKPKGAP